MDLQSLEMWTRAKDDQGGKVARRSHYSIHTNMCIYTITLMWYLLFLYVCVCVRVQGCSESSVAVVAHPRIDMAVWHLSAFLNCHGLHLHHPQLPPGMNIH